MPLPNSNLTLPGPSKAMGPQGKDIAKKAGALPLGSDQGAERVCGRLLLAQYSKMERQFSRSQTGQGQPHLHRDDNTGPPPRPTRPVPCSVPRSSGQPRSLLQEGSQVSFLRFSGLKFWVVSFTVGGRRLLSDLQGLESRWEVTDTKLLSVKKSLDIEAKFV